MSLTHVSGAITSVQTFTFTFFLGSLIWQTEVEQVKEEVKRFEGREEDEER